MAIQVQRRSDGKLFIDGAFRDAARGAASVVEEKSTGGKLGRQATASVADLDQAIAGAKAAQPAWAATGYDVRAGLLRKIARLLEERADEITDMIVRETGSIRGKAQYEVGASGNELYEAAALPSRATGEILPSQNTGKLKLDVASLISQVGALQSLTKTQQAKIKKALDQAVNWYDVLPDSQSKARLSPRRP